VIRTKHDYSATAQSDHPERPHCPVTPEAGLFVQKAEDPLAQLDQLFQIQLYEACGRNTYLAAVHAI
jgi:hypothetical protein